jgi:cell division protein FtsQ
MLAGRLVAALAIVAVLAGGWWVTNSKIFQLRTLRVVGNAHLSPAQVARLAGLSSSTNVFWFSSARAERKLESSPWVASATVSRMLPAVVTIVIHERFPVAVVSDAAGRAVLVAGDGIVLGPARRWSKVPVIGVPVLRTAQPPRIDPSDPGLGVAAGLPASLRGRVASIEVAQGGQVTLWLTGDVRVRFGDASEVPVKGQALTAVMAWATRNGVDPAYVDVSAPAAPALLPKAGAGVLVPVP